jgi:hypothetical protein
MSFLGLPAVGRKAGIQKLLTSLDSRLCGSDKWIIVGGSLKSLACRKAWILLFEFNRQWIGMTFSAQ